MENDYENIYALIKKQIMSNKTEDILVMKI